MSFLAELKRRNVLRVAAAYLVLSWLLVQVGSILLPTFHSPDWVMQVLVLILAGGFVAALVFSWVYELTPEGLKRESEIDQNESIAHVTARKLDIAVIALLVLALGVFTFDRLSPGADAPEASRDGNAIRPNDASRDAATESLGRRKSIAVLPFVNMSSDPEQVYFADGIAEDLLNALVKLPGLKVAGRTSSFAFREKRGDLREIGRALGVGHILEGSVRRQGARVRITAQLIKADDGFHLWSETYDRDIVDIFALQDEITRAIVAALKVKLGSDAAPTAPVADVEAYKLYLQAREKLALRGGVNLAAATALFEQSIALDPGYAPAHADLGRTLALHGTYPGDATNPEPLEPADAARRARAAAYQALALDPESADAWSVLGTVSMFFDFDWEAAGKALDRSVALSPNDAEIANFVGDFYTNTLDPRAVATEQRAAELDPLHAVNHNDLALAHFTRGQYAEALRAMDAADALGFYNQLPHSLLAIRLRALLALGRLAEAKQVSERVSDAMGADSIAVIASRIEIALAEADRARVDALTEEMLARARDAGGPLMLVAWYLVQAGRPEEAAPWFARMVEARSTVLTIPSFLVLPERLPPSPALRAALAMPELDALFELRRRNLAKTAGANP